MFPGLAASEGNLWREHRRFSLATLRDLGMGKTWFEDAIIEEIVDVAEMFKESNKAAVDPRKHLTLAVSNQIAALAFGKRYKHSDNGFLRLCNLFGENLRILQIISPVQYFPFLRYVPFGKIQQTWTQFFKNIEELTGFIETLVGEHKKQSQDPVEMEERNDYIDSFNIEREKHKGPDSTFTGRLIRNLSLNTLFKFLIVLDKQLTMSVLNLFAAGTETTTTTLLWSLIYMIENPEVQRKVHEEIDANIGRDRPIRIGDKRVWLLNPAIWSFW